MLTDEGTQGGGAEPQIQQPDVTVDLSQDPPPEQDGGQGGQPKPSRAERRQARGEDLSARWREADARAQRAEDEARRANEALAELRGRFDATEKRQTANQPDPEASRLDEIATQMESAISRMGTGDAAAVKEWHALRREEAQILGRQAARAMGAEVEGRVTKAIPQAPAPELQPVIARYPQIADDRGQFRAIWNAHMALLVNGEGRNMRDPKVAAATYMEAATRAARDLKIGGDAGPSDVERDRLAGTAGRDSGAGNSTSRVTVTADQAALAVQMFRSLPKEQAIAKWWKEIGSKLPK